MLEPIPELFGQKQVYIWDKWPVYCRATQKDKQLFTLALGYSIVANSPHVHALGLWAEIGQRRENPTCILET